MEEGWGPEHADLRVHSINRKRALTIYEARRDRCRTARRAPVWHATIVRALRRACAACGIVILHVADRVYNEYVIHCAAENVCGLNGTSSTQYIPFECNLYTACISFYFICISFVYHLYVMFISFVYHFDERLRRATATTDRDERRRRTTSANARGERRWRVVATSDCDV